jgi:hypothetical protein
MGKAVFQHYSEETEEQVRDVKIKGVKSSEEKENERSS